MKVKRWSTKQVREFQSKLKPEQWHEGIDWKLPEPFIVRYWEEADSYIAWDPITNHYYCQTRKFYKRQ